MALCSTYRVSPGQLFSSIGWIKRGFPSCTQPAPSTHQRQIISLPFVLKQSRRFSISQCVRTTLNPTTLDALRLRTQAQAGGALKSVFESVKLSSRLAGAKTLCGNTAEHRCGFGTTTSAATQLGKGSGGGAGQESERGTGKTSAQEDWALRLANENGFLSWCRNSYLTTVVAIAMLAEGTTPLAMQAAEGAFFVAGLNLTWGTYQYIYNLLRLRRRTGVSAVGALLFSSMALLHIGLWLIVCTLFLGYTDDDADGKPVKEETRNPGSKGEDV